MIFFLLDLRSSTKRPTSVLKQKKNGYAIIGTRELTFTDPQENITKLLENLNKYLNQEFLTPKQSSKVAE